MSVCQLLAHACLAPCVGTAWTDRHPAASPTARGHRRHYSAQGAKLPANAVSTLRRPHNFPFSEA